MVSADEPSDGIISVAWSPDGQIVTFGRIDGTISLENVLTQASLSSWQAHSDRVTDIAWSPDGRHLATASFDRLVKIWDASTGMLNHELAGHTDWVLSVTWTPDGANIISGSAEEPGNLRVWNAVSGQQVLATRAGSIGDFAWSRDGSILAYTSPVSIVGLVSGETFQPLDFFLDVDFPTVSAAWSPDDALLAIGQTDGSISVWSVADRQTLYTVQGSSTPITTHDFWITSVQALAFAEDGLQFMSVTADGTVRNWNTETGTLSSATRLPTSIRRAEWSPYAGQLLYADTIIASSQDQQQTLPNIASGSVVETVVPFPSLDRLADIQAACVADAPGVATLPAPESTPQPDAIAAVESLAAQDVTALTFDALPAYIAQVESLPEGSIPPACAADLIAVAAAVIAEGSAGSE
jgi:WD40 repeat protein